MSEHLADTAQPTVEPPVGGRLTVGALLSAPAAAAVAVGMIYALGAIVRSLELVHAGISVRDAFPLIPIQQHLGAGIQILVEPLILVSLLLGIVSCVLGLLAGWLNERRHKPPQSNTAGGTSSSRTAWYAFLGTFSLGLLLWHPVLLAGVLLGGAACVVLLLALASPGQLRRGLWPAEMSGGLLLALVIVFVAVYALTVELISPLPLSTVTLRTTSGQVISGPLVTLADGTWYLGGASHRLLAVDANEVRTAAIVANHRKPDDPVNENLIRIIFG